MVETGKGKCSINPFLVEPYTTGKASAKNIADGAYALIERCAPRSGGIAVNIGQCNPREERTECDCTKS